MRRDFEGPVLKSMTLTVDEGDVFRRCEVLTAASSGLLRSGRTDLWRRRKYRRQRFLVVDSPRVVHLSFFIEHVAVRSV